MVKKQESEESSIVEKFLSEGDKCKVVAQAILFPYDSTKHAVPYSVSMV